MNTTINSAFVFALKTGDTDIIDAIIKSGIPVKSSLVLKGIKNARYYPYACYYIESAIEADAEIFLPFKIIYACMDRTADDLVVAIVKKITKDTAVSYLNFVRAGDFANSEPIKKNHLNFMDMIALRCMQNKDARLFYLLREAINIQPGMITWGYICREIKQEGVFAELIILMNNSNYDTASIDARHIAIQNECTNYFKKFTFTRDDLLFAVHLSVSAEYLEKMLKFFYNRPIDISLCRIIEKKYGKFIVLHFMTLDKIYFSNTAVRYILKNL